MLLTNLLWLPKIFSLKATMFILNLSDLLFEGQVIEGNRDENGKIFVYGHN